MAATKYTYSIASDFTASTVDVGTLSQEIAASAIVTAIDHIDTFGDVCDVWFKDALSAGDKTTLDNDTTGPSGGLIGAHSGEAPAQAVEEVRIQEEETKTGGRYQATSLVDDIPATVGWHDFPDKSWPHPVGMLSAEAHCRLENHKDEIEVLLAPDTIIGTVSADVSASATVIDVSQSVIDNTFVGAYVKLDDGTNSDDCGRVTAIDDVNDQITLETATTSSFLAATPTYVKQTVRMIDALALTEDLRISVGESKIGASHIPANTVMRFRYNNKNGVAKHFACIIEYLY